MRIKEIIVVEGRDDTIAVQRAVEADTIETRGSAINKQTIEMIKKAQELRGVIVFTDPDYAGERIRKIISKHVPGVTHAFIPRNEAIKNNNIGVENASNEAIIAALKNVKTELVEEHKETISWERLVEEGLIAGKDARTRRMKLGDILGIGYTNGKQLYKRLRMFQVSNEEFSQALRMIIEESE